ncbi:cytochrome c oxidase, subunit VIa [Gautieria morchelliformis]|nr:cytochrome c oxidase, subunit VIa [Gautieria morchelliformis]
MSRALSLSLASRAARISSRRFATAVDNSYFAERQAVKEHAAHTADLWRKVSFFVCIPATIVCVAWVRNVEAEHAEHIEHIKAENGGELPETPAYDYLNKRGKPFPWGMNTLFFNPHSNKNLEEGAEE